MIIFVGDHFSEKHCKAGVSFGMRACPSFFLQPAGGRTAKRNMKRVPERNEPENLAKIFWRFAPKYGDFAFKYDQKCSIFSGASRQK